MNKITYAEFLRQTDGSDIQDGRFFVVNSALVEIVTAEDGDYIVAYQAHDVCGPDYIAELKVAYDAQNCIGVLHIPGDQWAKANAMFTELFGVAMKSGLQGVKEYYIAAV